MFFSKIYRSWEGIQEEKYGRILRGIEPDVLGGIFSGRVIDVGSGSGFFEKFLQKQGFDLKEWVCIDPDPDTVKQGGFNNILGDGNHLPFREGSFDNLICLDSIHLIREDIFRVLRPGGHTLVSLFCNPGNIEERREYLEGRMEGFEVVREMLSRGRENEIFILARKR